MWKNLEIRTWGDSDSGLAGVDAGGAADATLIQTGVAHTRIGDDQLVPPAHRLYLCPVVLLHQHRVLKTPKSTGVNFDL